MGNDFLFRYMRARHRFKEKVEGPLPPSELATLISLGKQEFDEIYVEPGANPPIVLDGKAGDVFDAIIHKKYRASGQHDVWIGSDQFPDIDGDVDPVHPDA